ncbi:hypothetical protein BCR39DRAFT_23363 [Naematelia encephala]|uniref:FAS1 domain-containing protein n=1 Tax=Naematelia encephala TaxID=71784 RepID=A0A1Y2BLK3_9TREE|nr:hypothetical protein BCR39DRAFT_23363 [Naematelia encephala]
MHLLALFVVALWPLPLSLSQLELPDCPDTSLTDYLVALIDALYANGLTTFESLITSLSETEGGYDLLSSWYNSQSTLTLLAPTDTAFQSAGITPPFKHLSEWEMVNLMSLHTLDGQWDYEKLPAYPLHSIASTDLVLAEAMNSTVNTTASQVAVLQQAQDGGNVVQVKADNVTAKSWSGLVNLSAASQLWNLQVLPIDSVLPLPPKLSVALTLPTSSRSANGFNNLTSLLSSSSTSPSMSDLEALTVRGFTIFAPVDDAWENPDVKVALNDSTLASNHYTTTYSLYSTAWYGPGQFLNLTLDSGASVDVVYNNSGNFVVMGDQSTQILRSDVLLENGVLHIIDKVLLPISSTPTSASTSPTSGNARPSESVPNAPTGPIQPITTPSAITSGNSTGSVPGEKDAQSSGAGILAVRFWGVVLALSGTFLVSL